MTKGSSRSSGSETTPEGLEKLPPPRLSALGSLEFNASRCRGLRLAYFHTQACKVAVTASTGIRCQGGEALLGRRTWGLGGGQQGPAVAALVCLRGCSRLSPAASLLCAPSQGSAALPSVAGLASTSPGSPQLPVLPHELGAGSLGSVVPNVHKGPERALPLPEALWLHCVT